MGLDHYGVDKYSRSIEKPMDWRVHWRGDSGPLTWVSLVPAAGGRTAMMGTKNRRFDSLPRDVSLEDLA